MGLLLSRNLATELLICNIKNTIKDLIKNYEIWTNESICINMEVILNRNLVKLSEKQLSEITVSIGYKANSEYSKEELCKIIINHYKRRIELLKLINLEIDKCANMLNRAANGPVCKNVNKYVDDFFTCGTIPNALWLDQEKYKISIQKLKREGRIDTFSKWINNLDKSYYKYLKKILVVIDIIKKDIDKNISQEDFGILEDFTKKILCKMTTICEIYYLLTINYK